MIARERKRQRHERKMSRRVTRMICIRTFERQEGDTDDRDFKCVRMIRRVTRMILKSNV